MIVYLAPNKFQSSTGVTASHPIVATDSVIHPHKRPHIIRSSTHRKYQSTIQHSSNFNFLRGHRLPPNRCHRFDHPPAQKTPHHSIIHTPQIPVHHPALVKFQFSKGSPPPTHRLRTPTTPTITHLHNTPRTLRRPIPHLEVKVSDNIRKIEAVTS